MKILFGSQTGTAEDFALELSNEAIAHQFAAEVQDLESYYQDDPVRVRSTVSCLCREFDHGDALVCLLGVLSSDAACVGAGDAGRGARRRGFRCIDVWRRRADR